MIDSMNVANILKRYFIKIKVVTCVYYLSSTPEGAFKIKYTVMN